MSIWTFGFGWKTDELSNQSLLAIGADAPQPKCHRSTKEFMKQIAIVFASFLLLAGCGFVHDERIDGPYRLIAVDGDDEMSLSYSLPGGNAIGRISSTVFAVGNNKKAAEGQAT